MKATRLIFALLLCISIPASTFAADASNGYKVTYDGGSLAETKVGTGMRLVINGDHVTFLKDKTEVISIPASTITEISYGQDVHRRVGAAIGLAVVSFGVGALMALTKSKKHYVGLTWADGLRSPHRQYWRGADLPRSAGAKHRTNIQARRSRSQRG